MRAIISLLLITILTAAQVTCTGRSCSDLVQVERKDVFNYLGNVTFPVPVDQPDGIWSLRVKTSNTFSFVGGWGVEVKSDGPRGIVSFKGKENIALNKDDLVTFRFRMYWKKETLMPLIAKMVWNSNQAEEVEICNNYYFAETGSAPTPSGHLE